MVSSVGLSEEKAGPRWRSPSAHGGVAVGVFSWGRGALPGWIPSLCLRLRHADAAGSLFTAGFAHSCRRDGEAQLLLLPGSVAGVKIFVTAGFTS